MSSTRHDVLSARVNVLLPVRVLVWPMDLLRQKNRRVLAEDPFVESASGGVGLSRDEMRLFSRTFGCPVDHRLRSSRCATYWRAAVRSGAGRLARIQRPSRETANASMLSGLACFQAGTCATQLSAASGLCPLTTSCTANTAGSTHEGAFATSCQPVNRGPDALSRIDCAETFPCTAAIPPLITSKSSSSYSLKVVARRRSHGSSTRAEEVIRVRHADSLESLGDKLSNCDVRR